MKLYQINRPDCTLQVYAKGVLTSETGILFLHGGPGSGAQAIMELPAFQRLEQSVQCTYFDQRGCGSSLYPLEQGIQIEDIVEDVRLVAADMRIRWNLKQLILWGGSFGGCLASLCLEKCPDVFDGCILSSPAITFNRQQALDFYKRMQEPYQKRMPNAGLDGDQKPQTPEEFFADQNVRAFIFSDQNPSVSLKHICAMSSWFFNHHFPHLFEACTLPLLVMQGKEDPICDYHLIDEQMSLHKKSTISYHLYDHAGHALFTDVEDDFVSKIQSFIEKVSAC